MASFIRHVLPLLEIHVLLFKRYTLRDLSFRLLVALRVVELSHFDWLAHHVLLPWLPVEVRRRDVGHISSILEINHLFSRQEWRLLCHFSGLDRLLINNS